jgi:diacylglycerol O-acyltransferase
MQQQLTAMDSIFLCLETPEMPGHIGGLSILDPSSHPTDNFDFDGFLEFVAERLALCPRFSWKLQEVPLGLDHPYWVEQESLDLKRHIHSLGVASPGGIREISELASLLFAKPLDRSKPMWEMYFIEGLQGGRVAVLWKVHHCLMDGVSGAGLVELLFDISPIPAKEPLVPVDDANRAGGRVGLLEMAARGLQNAARRPSALMRHCIKAGLQLKDQLQDRGLAGVESAPATPFNGVVGSERAIAWSRVSLERVKELKNELGVTVNDVVLALTADSVRSYLDQRGVLPERSLIAAVPVSIRSEGDKSLGNQVSEIGVLWGTDIEDPIERIYVIHEDARSAKESVQRRVNPLEAMAETLAPGAVRLVAAGAASAAEDMPLPANAVVSNVPMSPVPIYMCGAKIESIVPMSMLAPTQGLNITAVSYCGEMHFGVIADPDLVDSVWEIADAIPKALIELEERASRTPEFSS